MGKQAPKPPDYRGAAEQQGAANQAAVGQQTAANRPNQTNAFGASTSWSQGPDGQWRQTQSFGGPMGQVAGGLQQQLFSLGGAMDWGQFGQVGNGDAAVNQAYAQATSRLNPEWQQRETQLRSRLANQGIDPNSEAARGATAQFEQGRNDAYGAARAQSVGLGNDVFRNNMMARQQAISEALRARGQPLAELSALQGFLQQPGFMGAAAVDPTNYLQAAALQDNADYRNWMGTNEANADMWTGGLQAIGTAAQLASLAASDVRVKRNVQRHDAEALPGVPFASWEYAEGYGPPGRRVGVIAQDLEKVRPDLVVERADGLKFVDYSFLGANRG